MPIKKVIVDKSINVAYKYLKYLGAEVQIYGSLCVKSEPSQARIYLDGREVGTTTETITGLEPGEYTVEVRMNGYEVWTKSVEIEGGKKRTLTAVLQMRTGSISVKSEPANARIFLDGKEVGTTPGVIRSTVSGSHEVELKLDRYEVWSKRVTIEEDKEKALSAVLRIKAGSLMIESEPTNAKISLDGEEIGTTPNIIRSIAPDTYEVEVRMDGYDVWSEFVDVEGDKEKVITAVLQMKTGSISIKSKPTNAKIFLDGNEVGTTPDIQESVASGSHEVEVRKDGYDVCSKSVVVETDKKKSLTLELQINTGSISVKSEPAGARIFLDGKEAGTTPETLPAVTPGKHDVEVRKDRYEIWHESVDVNIGKEKTLTPVLQMKTGSIMIDSEPSNAMIFLDGKEVGATPETVTDLKPGKHTLEIKKARYEVWRESVETEADAVKSLTAVLQIKAGSIIIKSRPSKAKIFLDGKEVGMTPDIMRSIDPGTHEVEIRLEGHEVWRERVNVVADKEKALTAELQVKTGALVIDSEPANARIYLDGDKIGTTPNTLRYIIPGTHEVEVRMDGYEIWRESVDIEADIGKSLTATLRAKSGTISIKSKPTNAKIYLDGKEVGNTPVTVKPVRGIHEVEIRMDGYEIWRENVDVQADKEKTLTATLQLNTGTILVESEPANAKIYLDDKEAGKTPATIRPVCGTHTVEIRADGYEVWRQSVEVEADKEKSLTAALQIKTSSILVESEPANATIYLDGIEAGITPDTLRSIIPGRHVVEVKMDGYKAWSKSIVVKANKESAITAALQILTGSILIESEPANARIYLDGEEVGTTPESCRYITPGPHEMELKMDKYEVWREIVDVEAGKEKVLTVLLQLRTSSILIESEPTNAKIYLNGKNAGTTAETVTGLIPGKYTVEVRMDGYEVWSKNVEVKADTENNLTAVLQIKPGSISINSEPTKAKVYLNGENVGTTAETIADLTPGKYTVEVKLDGYATWHQVVEVDPDKETVLMAALQLKTGSIMIESEPTKAMIYLDGEEVGITPDTLWYIVPGKHEIIVETDGYEVWSEIVDVEEDKQKALTAELQIKTGSIAIESKPSNAVVFLDGEEVGKTPETLTSIVPGAHEVQVRMDSYEVWNKQVNIKPDREKAITAILQLKTGSINIKSDVTDAKICIDGEEIATIPETITGLVPGKYTVEVRMDGYEDWSKIVAVEADKESVLTVALQMMAGSIMMESEPTKATIYLDGKDVGKAPEIIKNILPGKHLLEARMDGYEDWSEIVDVEAYNDYTLKAILLAKPGSLSIKSEPTNATIYLDNEEIGITPQNVIDLKPGKYTVEVRMNRYEVWSECVDVVPDKTITLKAPLQLRTGSIMIESVPTKASIYLDGKKAGVTPETLRSIVPGTHKLETTMDGLEIWSEIVEVEADKENTLKAVLQLKPGSINIKSKPTNATMYLDGKRIGTTPATITDLMPGEYMLELKLDGYDVWGENINVETNIEEALTATLQLKTGSIMIDSEPANATIYIDGEKIGTTPDIIIRPVTPGKHKVEIRKDGYNVWNGSMEIDADKEKSLTAVLQSKTGSVMIDSVPANATIYLDGEKCGITPDTIMSATPGVHEVEVKLDGYEVWRKKVNVKADKNKALTAVLRITTGAIKIDSEPAKATIYLDGKKVATTPDTIRSIAPGTHEIEVRMKGHEKWKKSVKVNVGKEKALTAILQIKTGSITIESTPVKADIYIDGEKVGKTPASLKSIIPGRHEMEVRMDGYEIWSESVDIEAETETTLTAVLDVRTGSIKIESEPTEAKIYLDGEEAGTTPDTLGPITIGTHSVEIRLDGYEVWSDTATIEPDKESALKALLQIKNGSIRVESTPAGADIYLDGEKAGTTPDTLLSIVPAQHEVEIKMDDYEVCSETVVVETNKESLLTASLKLRTGSLSIKSKPSKAKVFLNGEDIGTLPKTLTELKPGKYSVEVSLPEYEVWSETVDIEADLKKTLTAELLMKAGSIKIESKPAKAKVYLDGEEVGTTPATLMSVSPGTHEVEVTMDGYDVWSEIVEIEADKEKALTSVLRMRTGSFSVNSEPANAKIYLDGDYIGTTPDIIRSSALGTHVVEIRKEGYEVWREIVDIKIGEGNAITAALQLKTGDFKIESNPSMAMVYIDGREVGTTPVSITDLKPGKCAVEVKMDGYRTWDKKVNIKADIENIITATLRINTGSIMIDSEPTKAAIFLNDKEVGTTPETITCLNPAKYNVEVRLDGYEAWSKSTKVKIGKESVLKAELQIKSGSVSINSKPSNARIYIDGEEVGITPDIIKSIDSGTHEVEVKKDGYETWSESVDIEADKEKSLTVVLRIKTSSISIDSNPPDAVIYLDGKEVGMTPDTLKSITPGTHEVEVRMDGYETWNKIVNVESNEEKTLTAALQPKAGSLSIESKPAHADIFLDGEEAGVTPVILKSVAPGIHKIEVRMDGYESWSESVNVEADKETAITATLQIKATSLMIESEPAKAKIFLDNEEFGTTPENITALNPGKYTVEVMMDGYELWTEIVDVEADKDNSLKAVLQKKTGSISIKSRPSKAEILLNGDEAGTAPKILSDLNPGKYTVEVMMDGYDVWSEIVEVEADKENTLTATLQIKTCSINIKSEPTKAKILLDGEEVGTTPENLTDLKPAKYTIEVRMDGYESWREIVDVEADKDNALTATLQIKTTTISIKSKPSKANIYIDGNDAGTTPGIIKSISPGAHEIEVKMDGYEVWSKSIDVEADKEMNLTATLQTKSGSINIKSKPSKAMICLDGKEVGTTPDTLKPVTTGAHEIEVSMDGYDVWSESIDVEADKEMDLTAELQIKTTSISIKSKPSKANIYIDGNDAGITPGIIKSVSPGTHKIEVKMDGYEVWSKSIDVEADKEMNLTATLQTKSGSINIKSKPSKAMICLDGKEVGTTPDTLKPVTTGAHEIEVRMDGYDVWSESIEVEADKEMDLTAELQIKTTSISIKSKPSKANIYIDGDDAGITPGIIKSVSPGTHKIEVKMDGYEVWSETIDVKADKEMNLTAELIAKSGSINIKSEPAKARIYLDDEEVGTTPDTLKSVAPGKHEIEVRMDGYDVWSKKLDVEAGKETVLKAALQMKVGSINVKSDPANATIFLDGKNVGITPETIYIFALSDLKPEKHTVEVRMDGYEVWSEIVDVVADKEKFLTAKLQMRAGSISIKSDPAKAMILLDNKSVGTTPMTITDLKPGKYKIEVKMDGYEVWSENVKLDIGKKKALTAALQITAASISIESEPAKASIYLDGKEFGKTPAMRKSIDPGKHEVEVRMEGYQVWSKIVNLKAGKEKLLTATLQIMSGTIRIESTPTKARIYLDGEDVGTTPDILRSISLGTHEVKVKTDGYKVWSKTLNVETGKEKTLTAALQKVSSPVDVKPETSSKTLTQLRSSYDKLSVSQIESLPHISIRERHKHIFLCHSTINHDYEVKTINGDEIVIDHATKLVWHQSGSSAYMDMRKAKKWLKKLNLGGYSGYHDWRLPTLEEASTLLELNMENGNFINPVFDKKQWGMWTDDRVGKNHAWIVTFINGTINQSHIGSPATFVRPVRSLK